MLQQTGKQANKQPINQQNQQTNSNKKREYVQQQQKKPPPIDAKLCEQLTNLKR